MALVYDLHCPHCQAFRRYPAGPGTPAVCHRCKHVAHHRGQARVCPECDSIDATPLAQAPGMPGGNAGIAAGLVLIVAPVALTLNALYGLPGAAMLIVFWVLGRVRASAYDADIASLTCWACDRPGLREELHGMQ